MSVVYSSIAVTARLQSVSDTIGATGSLLLYAGGTLVATIPLANPAGTADDNILTFDGAPITVTAADSGTLTTGQILNSDGSVGIAGLSIGITEASDDIIVSNGLNNTYVTADQQVSMLAGQIETL